MPAEVGFISIVYRNGRWKADLVADQPVVRQLREEAGLKNNAWPDGKEVYDALLVAASHHGLGLQTQFPHTQWDQAEIDSHN
jgi:hypothetical protein